MKMSFLRQATIAAALLLAAVLSSCKPHVTADCDFKMPEGYRLSQNKNGDWAILSSSGDILGYTVRYNHYDFYPQESTEAMTFSDSCKAKGLLKQYLESKDMNEFK